MKITFNSLRNPVHYLLAFLLTLALLLFARPASAGTGNVDFGITNAAFAGAATFTATGARNADVSHQDNVTLVFRGTVITSNTLPTATLTFARVDSEGNVESTPRFTWGAIPLATGGDAGTFVTNSLVAVTNVPQAAIGAASGLKLINVTTAVMTGPATITSPVLKVELKSVRKEN